ncbi:MAG: diguanylate cyclase, partial [Synergistaceae bacterium]|nr:diguanylate cyclase [Synergistaceae bacterium]
MLAIQVILIVIAGVAMLVFQRQMALKIRQHAYQTIQESAKTQVIAFNIALDGKYEIIETLANLPIMGKDFDIEKIILYMENFVKVSKFSSVGYADIEGNAYLHNGQITKINDRKYFKKAIKGERAIEWVEKGKVEKKTRILISVPIKDKNGVKGIIFASYTDENFRKFLNPQGFGKEGYSYVCQANGDIIASSKKYDFLTDSQNIFESLRSAILDKGYTLEQRIADIHNLTPGIFSYTIHGQHRYASYQPIGVNNWIIFNVVPASIVNADFKIIAKSGQISMVIVLLSAISLILFIIILDMKQARALAREHEQLLISEEEYRITAEQSGKLVFRYDINTKTQYNQPKMAEVLGLPLIEKNAPESSIESGMIAEESIEDYRLFYDAMQSGAPEGIVVSLTRMSSGEFIWYRGMFTMIYSDAGQPLHAIVSLENFTIQRDKELAYKRWQQKLDSIQRKNITYYECNLTRDLCERKEGNLPYQFLGNNDRNFSTMVDYAVKHLIFDEDINIFERFFSRKRILAAFCQGTTNDIFEYRIKKEDGTVNWINVSIQMVQEAYSTDIKALIMFEDIDEKKRAELLLQTQANQDPLTGVLNRNEFVRQMTALIDEGDLLAQHAFIMIDIDDFKDINDMFGHIEGDKALVEITDNLKKIMRCGDLLGRLGGDEFMICLKNIPNDEVISKRAELI